MIFGITWGVRNNLMRKILLLVVLTVSAPVLAGTKIPNLTCYPKDAIVIDYNLSNEAIPLREKIEKKMRK